MKRLALSILLSLVLVACAPQATPIPQPTAANTAVPTATVVAPTATPSPAAPEPYQRRFPSTAGDDGYLVGAYFYPWYGPGRGHWQDGYAGQPVLGEYDSTDPTVINQQIDWATGHGIDFFAVSWWGPGSREDTILRQHLLQSQLAPDIRFAVLYESTGRLAQSADGTFNLDDPVNRQKLLDDLTYLQATHWRDSQYLRIEGRPAVILYLTRSFSGDVTAALGSIRQELLQRGDDVYLIGDEVYWQNWETADLPRLQPYDAVTAYNMHTSVPGIADYFTSKVSQAYSEARQKITQAGVASVPDVIPGFDDTSVRPTALHPPIPRSPLLFAEQLDMALGLVDPALKMVLVTSWNEWHEDTSIEPAQSFGFEYLDVLQARLRAMPPALAVARDDGKVYLGDTLILDGNAEAPGCWGVNEVAYSPTNQHFLVLLGCFEGDDTAFLFRADGSDKRRITEKWDVINYSNAIWSPDGQAIAYERINSCCADVPADAPADGLIRYDVQSGKKTVLVKDAHLMPMAWSPDGRWIAFWLRLKPDTETGTVYLTAADGSSLWELGQVAWPGDGARLRWRWDVPGNAIRLRCETAEGTLVQTYVVRTTGSGPPSEGALQVQGLPLPVETTLYRVVNVASNDVLNVRSADGADSPIVGTIQANGTGIRLTGASVQAGGGVWVPIQYQGISGWVNSKYLEPDNP